MVYFYQLISIIVFSIEFHIQHVYQQQRYVKQSEVGQHIINFQIYSHFDRDCINYVMGCIQTEGVSAVQPSRTREPEPQRAVQNPEKMTFQHSQAKGIDCCRTCRYCRPLDEQASALETANSFLQALQIRNRILKHCPNSCLNMYGRGMCLEILQNPTEAEKAYKQSINLNFNKQSGPHYGLGRFYLGMNRFAEAENQFIRSINLEPTGYLSYWMLGLMYAMQQKFEMALKQFFSVLRINPPDNDKDIYLRIAECYLKLNKFDESLKYYRLALNQNISEDNKDYARTLIQRLSK